MANTLSNGVNINSITRSNGVVTVVTATAHGLVVGQGFSLQNTLDTSFNWNGVILTVPNSTSFTFSQNVASVVQPGAYYGIKADSIGWSV